MEIGIILNQSKMESEWNGREKDCRKIQCPLKYQFEKEKDNP